MHYHLLTLSLITQCNFTLLQKITLIVFLLCKNCNIYRAMESANYTLSKNELSNLCPLNMHSGCPAHMQTSNESLHLHIPNQLLKFHFSERFPKHSQEWRGRPLLIFRRQRDIHFCRSRELRYSPTMS